MAWTLLTWNIRGSARPDLADLAEVIGGYAPDVVLLQEVWRPQASRIARAAGFAHSFWSFKHSPFGPVLPMRAEGMAILSRTALEETSSEVLTPAVRSWTHRRRIVQYAQIPSLGVWVANVHLASHAGADDRVNQAEVVASHVGAASGPWVVAGDFNAVDEPAVWQPFAHIGVTDAWAGGTGFTNPSGAVRQRLDRVLVGAGLVARSVEVPDDGPAWVHRSDHLPVIARID